MFRYLATWAFLCSDTAAALVSTIRSNTEDPLLDAMLAHLILIHRPFVATPLGVRLPRAKKVGRVRIKLVGSMCQNPFCGSPWLDSRLRPQSKSSMLTDGEHAGKPGPFGATLFNRGLPSAYGSPWQQGD